MIERMFDSSLLPEPAALPGVGDAGLIGAIEGYARASAANDARRLAAIAELSARRCEDPDDERQWWACDPTDAAAAEVAAALNIGQRRAIGQLSLAVLLRDRFRQINTLFLAGSISLRLVETLMWRTMFVADEVLEAVDAALAQDAVGWGPLSQTKLEQRIDVLIEEHDPLAVRRLQTAARGRDISIGDRDDATGTASVWGRMLAPDAALLRTRLTAMAHGVCNDDPRTLGQRRSDAMGALAAGSEHLSCLCGKPDCPAASADGRAGAVVIHIVADHSALTAQPDPALHGEDTPPTPKPAPAPKPVQVRRPGAGVIVGGAIVPAPMLAELIRTGAKVQFVGWPGAEPEPHYRPSAKLAEFVRIRDLTCRFPGCDRPVDFADIDHTTPWPGGATHPSGLKCFCRLHHLLKTFWSSDGWADEQHPDGTITITTPTGLTYTTKPVTALYFPGWNTTTSTSPPTGKPPPAHALGLTMPKRKHTRTQNRDHRIKAEREHNAAHLAENAEPTPF
jgi:Domain of unknown function (DUF222)